MGKWKIRSCPRCCGSLFVDRDIEGWYEQCIWVAPIFSTTYNERLPAFSTGCLTSVTRFFS